MNPRVVLSFKLAVLAGLVLFPAIGSSFYVELVAKILVMSIFAMSLALLVGFTGLVSLGHYTGLKHSLRNKTGPIQIYFANTAMFMYYFSPDGVV